jgi:hypothetical protein
MAMLPSLPSIMVLENGCARRQVSGATQGNSADLFVGNSACAGGAPDASNAARPFPIPAHTIHPLRQCHAGNGAGMSWPMIKTGGASDRRCCGTRPAVTPLCSRMPMPAGTRRKRATELYGTGAPVGAGERIEGGATGHTAVALESVRAARPVSMAAVAGRTV